jgi:hypothetical protein
MMSNLTIRPLTPDGYPAAVEIESIACHCPPRTVEEIRFEEERYDSQSKFRRSVVESRQVGIVGVGSALYDCLMESMKPFDPLVLATWIREDLPRGVRFLEDRGFHEFMRDITKSACADYILSPTRDGGFCDGRPLFEWEDL